MYACVNVKLLIQHKSQISLTRYDITSFSAQRLVFTSTNQNTASYVYVLIKKTIKQKGLENNQEIIILKNRTVLAKTCNLNLYDSLGTEQWKVIERKAYLTLSHNTNFQGIVVCPY